MGMRDSGFLPIGRVFDTEVQNVPHVVVDSSALPAGAATEASLSPIRSAVAADGATAPANCVYIGGYVLGTGEITGMSMDANGNFMVTIADSGGDKVEILSAGADNVANTTDELVVGSFGYVFDGSAWDRMRGDSTDGVLVNLGTNNDISLNAGTNIVGQVDVNALLWISSASSDVDNSAVTIFDCSAANAGCRYITVTNCGTGDLFVRVGGTDPVADGSTAYYDFKLALGETRWIPVGYNSGTANDVKAIRAAAQTNDNVIVAQYGYRS